jgi:hypothetical protein
MSFINKSTDRSAFSRIPKWKAINMGGDNPRSSCGKTASDRQIFIIGYLKVVERKHLNAALCSARGFSALSRKSYKRFSMTVIATPLKNGSVKPSGSPPIEMAAMYNPGGQNAELIKFLQMS